MLNAATNLAQPSYSALLPSGLGVGISGFDANIVPSNRQSVSGITSKSASETLTRDYARHVQPTLITHPRQAPSSVSSEQFLAARNLLSPAFQHNVMATRIARTSNLHVEAPRFRDQIDILA
jgi:hypothetical protein